MILLHNIIGELGWHVLFWPKSILGRLWANFILVIVLMSILVFSGWKISDSVTFLQKELEYLHELEYTLMDATQDIGNFAFDGDFSVLNDGLSDIRRMAEKVKLLRNEISTNWKSTGSLLKTFISMGIIDVHANSEELVVHLDDILKEIHGYISLLENFTANSATEPATRNKTLMMPRNNLQTVLMHVIQEQGGAFNQAMQTSRNVFIGSVVLALLMATIIIFLFYRSLIRPLKQGANFAKQVAMGNLNAKITHIPQNEIGMLLETMDGMRGSLFLLRTLWESTQPLAVLRDHLELILDLILIMPCFHLQDKGAIIVLNDTGDSIDMMVSRRLPDGLEDCYRRFAFSANLCGKAALTGSMVYAEDSELWKDVHCSDMEPYGHFCIPFFSKDRVLGAISLYVDTVYSPDHEIQTFLTRVGQSLAEIIGRKKADMRIRQTFHQDQIVGFSDQALFRDCLKQAIAKAKHRGTSMALLFAELNRLADIDDNPFVSDGDPLLMEGVRRLISCLREKTDIVTHIGGDGFAIILGELKHSEDASVVAAKILKAFEMPFVIHDKSCFMGISIGIAIHPQDGENDETLFRKANVAFYRIKQEGKSAFRIYEEGMEDS